MPVNYNQQYVKVNHKSRRINAEPAPKNTAGNMMKDWQAQMANTMSAVFTERARQLALQKQQQSNKILLDEELKRPATSANPGSDQRASTLTGHDGSKAGGLLTMQIDDEFMDGSSYGPLTPYSETQNVPPQQADIANSSGNPMKNTATLTTAEFANGKGIVLSTNSDVHVSDQEKDHMQNGTDNLTPQPGSSTDTNPTTPYSNPQGTADTPTNPKPTTAKVGSISANSTSNDGASSTPQRQSLDRGLLGFGALLSGLTAVYGITEGISSQYVVGAMALTLYCSIRLLDLKV